MAKPAIMVVDFQHDFTHPDGVLAVCGADISANQRAVEATATWLPRFRAAGLPIVWIKQIASPATDTLARRLLLERKSGWTGGTGVDPCREGTWGAEIDGRLSPEPGDAVVTKHRYSAFYATDLELVLAALRPDSLVICGTAVNACVEATARDAYMRGHVVRLARELTGWSQPDLSDYGFASIDRYSGEVLLIDDLWERYLAGDHRGRGLVDASRHRRRPAPAARAAHPGGSRREPRGSRADVRRPPDA